MIWMVITGAGNGIGRALAIEFISNEFNVLAIDMDEEKLLQLQEMYPNQVTICNNDIAEMDETLAEQISEMIPKGDEVKYLVHNAAYVIHDTYGTITKDMCDRTFAVNVSAPALLSQAFRNHLSKSSGRILHVGTQLIHDNLRHITKGLFLYTLSKTALNKMASLLREELKESGICITSATPGMTDTQAFWEGHKDAKVKELPIYPHIQNILDRGVNPHPTEKAAKFYYFVMTQVDDVEYESKEWDIYKVEESRWNN